MSDWPDATLIRVMILSTRPTKSCAFGDGASGVVSEMLADANRDLVAVVVDAELAAPAPSPPPSSPSPPTLLSGQEKMVSPGLHPVGLRLKAVTSSVGFQHQPNRASLNERASESERAMSPNQCPGEHAARSTGAQFHKPDVFTVPSLQVVEVLSLRPRVPVMLCLQHPKEESGGVPKAAYHPC